MIAAGPSALKLSSGLARLANELFPFFGPVSTNGTK
jgi:hypothetical protein